MKLTATRCAPVVSLAAIVLLAGLPTAAEVLVESGTTMKYLRNAADPSLGPEWTGEAFDDAAWTDGVYGIGFDTQGKATALIQTPVPAAALSIYTRTHFQIEDLASVTGLFIGADYDDGFAAWVNGVEVYRSSELPSGPLAWNTPASDRESSNAEAPHYLPIRDVTTNGLPALVAGDNVLAIGIWNRDAISSDLVLVPELSTNRTVQVRREAYLQNATPTTMTVRWRTDLATTSRVRAGRLPGQLGRNAVDFEEVSDHELTLTGLTPNTNYYYSFGTADEVLGGADAEHRFRTPPSIGTDKPTRIWVLGDSGSGNLDAMAVRDAYYEYSAGTPTDLWLMLGDNAYESGTDIEFQEKLFDIYPEMLRRAPLYPTLGNHDGVAAESATQTGPYYDMFTLPRHGESGGVPSGTEAYYSFDFANIHFIVLDSHETPRVPTGAMLLWLAEDLAATTQDWVIAYWHHPPYSKGVHDSDVEAPLIEMRENVVPILEDHGVDLVLTGHSHSYERSFLLDGHYGDSTTFSDLMKVDGGDGRIDGDGPYLKPFLGPEPHFGAVYTVAGSSGKITGGDLNHPAKFVSFNLLGSMVLDVNGDRLDARFLAADGQVLDEFTIVKGVVPPTAALAANPVDGPAPLSVDFRDTSSGTPTSWEWDVDDSGAIDSAEQDPTHVYTSPGVYSVRLAVSNLAGADETVAERLICVHEGPPSPIVDLVFSNGTKIDLAWNPRPDAMAYDVLRGNLVNLRANRGDFSAGSVACLGDNSAQPWAIDPLLPGVDQAFFYVVRATNCASDTGTYDSVGPGQVDSRDHELQSPNGSCACDPEDDFDNDGFCDEYDNCPAVHNPNQYDVDNDGEGGICDDCTDTDGDGWGDPGFPINLCLDDNCPDAANSNQSDGDGDGSGDVCDPCPADALNDGDDDGLCADVDNCPDVANPNQTDSDGDGIGDACDSCAAGGPDDADGDGVCTDADNCPDVANADQADTDDDGDGDVCDPCTDLDGDDFGDPGFAASTCPVDNCPDIANPDQFDWDFDGLGNVCDMCPDDFENDGDADGYCGGIDNCPETTNPGQEDLDGDAIGDACDRCTDVDKDGFGNPGFTDNTCPTDNCPDVANPGQEDGDGDGRGNECDPCPEDAADDADGDGWCAGVDNCPSEPNPDQGDADSDNVGDLCDTCTDLDGDGFGNPGWPLNTCPADNCPAVFNDDQVDADGDGSGDACDECTDSDGDGFGNPGTPGVCPGDNCPDDSNMEQSDLDADGLGDACDPCPLDALNDADGDGICGDEDNCPDTPNPDQDNADVDGYGDACDACTDTDRDGHGNPGYDNPGCGEDNCPSAANPGQGDFDGDGLGNVCDVCTDGDGDGFGNPNFLNNECPEDNCPAEPNPGQEDADGDAVGDACDVCTDLDGDGFGDPGFTLLECALDNCPATANPDQRDDDFDGLGNVCDLCTDADGDGLGNPGYDNNTCPDDNCPGVANPGQADSDGDGRGDICDVCPDDPIGDPDGDGVCSADNCPGASNEDQADGDGDGHGDACDPCPADPFDDVDGDSICASIDNCPTLPNALQEDDDGDGIGNVCTMVPVDEGMFHVAATEVTNEQYAGFLNAVAQTDPNGLYNQKMGDDPRGGIGRSGTEGAYGYFTRPDMERKPVNFVSWSDAARYVNWLSNGQPVGPQAHGATESGTYDMGAADAGSAAARTPGAPWFLPTAAEWEMAAYVDPHVGTTWAYPTRSDDAPTVATADGSGAVANPGRNVANHAEGAIWGGVTGQVTTVAGGGPLSTSATGTYDQAGNVAEWTETPLQGNKRKVLGGAWNADSAALLAGSGIATIHSDETDDIGFRVAASGP